MTIRQFYRSHLKKYVPRWVFKQFPVFFDLVNKMNFNSFPLDKSFYKKINRNIKENLKTEFANLSAIRFATASEPIASVIIPVFNKMSYTYSCLSSLLGNTSGITFEVIIVDNGSTDETERLFKEKIFNAIYIKNSENTGFVTACNLGAEAARGKYLVFLNNDTYVLESWLNNLIKTFAINSRIGLVGSKLIYPDGKLQEAGGIVWALGHAENFGRYDSPNRHCYNYLKTVDYVSGAAIAIRKNVFEQVGGFDEVYSPAFYEDTDLAFKVRATNLEVVYQPLAEIVHFEGITAGKKTNSGFKSYQQTNRLTFIKKWEQELKNQLSKDDNNEFLARDRSQNRKLVLFIDNNVPTVNQDAGSYITNEYLKILAEENFKIVFWPINQQYSKIETEALEQQGVEVVCGDGSLGKYLSAKGKFFDFVVIARPGVGEYSFPLVKRYCLQANIFYLAHDLHFLRQEREAKWKNTQADTETVKKLEISLMSQTDKTLVFSDYEKELIREISPNVKVETLPWIQTATATFEKIDFDQRRDIVFLGGFNHPPNVAAARILFYDILPIVKRAIPNIKMRIIGHNPPESLKQLGNDNFEIIGQVKNPLDILRRCKIFVCPLPYGAGFKGKLTMAMSASLPIISTSVGVEGTGLKNGLSVLIEDDMPVFAEKIIELYKNNQLCEHLAENAHQLLLSNYSVERARQMIKKIFANNV